MKVSRPLKLGFLLNPCDMYMHGNTGAGPHAAWERGWGIIKDEGDQIYMMTKDDSTLSAGHNAQYRDDVS